jgi:hypothetical protein
MVRGEEVNVALIERERSPQVNHQEWTRLLRQYVSKRGEVNYRGFKADREALQRYLNQLSQNAPSKNWTQAQKLAYWINAYNAFTVKLIIDHYPIKSIKEISEGLPMINSPWDLKFFKIMGIEFDLNTIEHTILRGQFREPRIHFAINCASVSCPQLRDEAYTDIKLQD